MIIRNSGIQISVFTCFKLVLVLLSFFIMIYFLAEFIIELGVVNSLLTLYLTCAAPEEISAAVCDGDSDRLELARLYNEVKHF